MRRTNPDSRSSGGAHGVAPGRHRSGSGGPLNSGVPVSPAGPGFIHRAPAPSGTPGGLHRTPAPLANPQQQQQRVSQHQRRPQPHPQQPQLQRQPQPKQQRQLDNNKFEQAQAHRGRRGRDGAAHDARSRAQQPQQQQQHQQQQQPQQQQQQRRQQMHPQQQQQARSQPFPNPGVGRGGDRARDARSGAHSGGGDRNLRPRVVGNAANDAYRGARDAREHGGARWDRANAGRRADGHVASVPQARHHSAEGAGAAPGSAALPTARILAHGDSLTEGYHAGGLRFSPYTDHLARLVAGTEVDIPAAAESRAKRGAAAQEDRPARRRVVCHARAPVENLGKSGEKVGPMSGRLDARLASTSKPRPDVVIILGGTNNLSGSNSADSIVSVLHYMHRRCWEAGCVTGVVTLPQMTGDGRKPLFTKKLNMINAQLRRLALDNESRCFLVDLYVHSRQTDRSNDVLWDDNIHFGPTGYRKFAEVIAESLEAWCDKKDDEARAAGEERDPFGRHDLGF